MSSGVPMRRSAIESTSRCWPASPIACHCRSEAGLERHESRRHAVDADAVRAQLARGLAGEADEPRLGAGVGLDPGEAVGAPRARGDVHDRAAPGALHRGRHRAREVEGAVQVDRRRSRASRRPTPPRPADDLPGHAARGVDEHVDAAALRFRRAPRRRRPRPRRARPPRPVRHAPGATVSTAARVPSSSGAGTSQRPHRRALAGQLHADGAADAVAAPVTMAIRPSRRIRAGPAGAGRARRAARRRAD